MAKRRPIVLCILDGWGDRDSTEANAVRQARTPVFDALRARWPSCQLLTCGEDVGLPDGQFGNSEVGHMNLGAGRVVRQEIVRIGQAIREGLLGQNPALKDFIAKLKATGGRCHLMGLLSPGGVHAHQDHMAALAGLLDEAGVPVVIHGFLDGRDTPPKSAKGFVTTFLGAIEGLRGVSMGSLSGRYFAMDRDKRWERVEKAYRVIAYGQPRSDLGAIAAIQAAYDGGASDEFVPPIALAGYDGMRSEDGLLFSNFRGDRARELLAALLEPDFAGFERPNRPVPSAALGMVDYGQELQPLMTTLFPPADLSSPMGEILAKAGYAQLRAAETEKFPHVTYFFNGGREDAFTDEDRILVPSPKVATYDLQPEMSAPELADKVAAAIDSGRYAFVLINFANPDMVGHTGSLPAAIKAVETVDACLGRLVEAVERQGGMMLVTADHGNCETMVDPTTGEPHTAHTLNPVPCILVGAEPGTTLHNGRLGDIAPTLLHLLALDVPSIMDGRSLLDVPG